MIFWKKKGLSLRDELMLLDWLGNRGVDAYSACVIVAGVNDGKSLAYEYSQYEYLKGTSIKYKPHG